MSKPKDEITEAEFSVMEVLWARETGETVRGIVVAMYGRHEHSLHGGVSSFLERLIDKGYVKADKSAFVHRFFAAVTREQHVGWQLKRMAESHFGGALRPMMLSLLGQAKLSKKDRAAVEKLIENMKE